MAVVGTFTPTRGHLVVTHFNKIMSQSEMEPAESVAIRHCKGNQVVSKRNSQTEHHNLNLSSHLPQPLNAPAPQKKIIFKIKKAVSTKLIEPLPTYETLIRNGGKQIFRIQKMCK